MVVGGKSKYRLMTARGHSTVILSTVWPGPRGGHPGPGTVITIILYSMRGMRTLTDSLSGYATQSSELSDVITDSKQLGGDK